MKNLTDQKLLILGGVRLSCEIVKQAKQLGVYTIVTDYYEHSPAKRIADKSFMVSTTDVDEVVALIERENIDGVLTGFIDSMLPYYQEICKKSGLPCYGTKEQFQITTNKELFKHLCREYDVPVVDEFSISYPFKNSDINKLTYPVLVKPVDYSGSRGVFICKNQNDLINYYEKSLTFSRSGKVLIERLMNANEAAIFYLIQDGEIFLSAMADRHMKCQKSGILLLPVAYVFPSKHLERYQKYLNVQVIEMFKSIGVRNGMIFIQTFVEKGNCIFYEMGYRLTGSLEYKIISKFNGVNPIEMMINFALTGSMYPEPIKTMINPNYFEWGCNITFLAKPGKIEKIIGVDEVFSLPGVIDVVPAYHEGDTIAETAVGRLQQVILRVFATAATKEEMAQLMDQVHDTIKVKNTDGENMLLDVFDTQELFD